MKDEIFIKNQSKKVQNQQVGKRIKAIRKELGLTMKEFGEKFDPPASDSIVSRWENGINMPNNERLQKISELGNVSIHYLILGSEYNQNHDESKSESKRHNMLSSEQIDVLKIFIRNYENGMEICSCDIERLLELNE